jgi:hypothetical protein
LAFLYWEHRRWIAELELRISLTDAGLEWLMHVKAIGSRPLVATAHVDDLLAATAATGIDPPACRLHPSWWRATEPSPEGHPGFDRSGVVEYVAGSAWLMVVDTSEGPERAAVIPSHGGVDATGASAAATRAAAAPSSPSGQPVRGRMPAPDDRSSSRVGRSAIESSRSPLSGS